MRPTSGPIGNVEVMIEMGDIAKQFVDAYLIPQFPGDTSLGGVGGAIANNGGIEGLRDYAAAIQQNGPKNYGDVFLTPSGGGNASNHIHVTSVGSGKSKAFQTVQTGFYNALKAADNAGLHVLASPAFATGIVGELTNTQSAQAMMSAANRYSLEGGSPVAITFVILGDRAAFEDFAAVLRDKKYEDAHLQWGEKELNHREWKMGMEEMVENEKRFRPETLQKYSK